MNTPSKSQCSMEFTIYDIRRFSYHVDSLFERPNRLIKCLRMTIPPFPQRQLKVPRDRFGQ